MTALILDNVGDIYENPVGESDISISEHPNCGVIDTILGRAK